MYELHSPGKIGPYIYVIYKMTGYYDIGCSPIQHKIMVTIKTYKTIKSLPQINR